MKLNKGTKRVTIIFAIITAGLVLLSPFASNLPDGLEKTALNLGFDQLEKESQISLLKDYQIPFIRNDKLSTILAGATGAVGVFIIATAVSLKIKKKKKIPPPKPEK